MLIYHLLGFAMEAMEGHNVLEVLVVGDGTGSIGSKIEKIEKVLVKPGWSAFRQDSLKFSVACCQALREVSAKLSWTSTLISINILATFQFESFSFSFSVYVHVVKCAFYIEL